MSLSTINGRSPERWISDKVHRIQKEGVLDIADVSYRETRGTKTLLFWGDYPHWIIVNPAGELILSLIAKGMPIRDIVNIYVNEISLNTEEAIEDISMLVDPLIQVGVIYQKGSPPQLPSVEQQLDMDLLCRNITGVVINLTTMCNYRCRHCYADAGAPARDELSAHEIIDIVHQLDQYCRLKVLGLLGGEPLIRMKDLLKIAKSLPQGWTVSFSTNGSLVTEEFAKRAAELRMLVQISLDGATSTSCDYIRGAGAWEKAVKATKTLVSNGVITAINMVYHKGNFHELEQFIELGKDLNVNMVRFLPFRYAGRGLHSGMI